MEVIPIELYLVSMNYNLNNPNHIKDLQPLFIEGCYKTDVTKNGLGIIAGFVDDDHIKPAQKISKSNFGTVSLCINQNTPFSYIPKDLIGTDDVNFIVYNKNRYYYFVKAYSLISSAFNLNALVLTTVIPNPQRQNILAGYINYLKQDKLNYRIDLVQNNNVIKQSTIPIYFENKPDVLNLISDIEKVQYTQLEQAMNFMPNSNKYQKFYLTYNPAISGHKIMVGMGLNYKNIKPFRADGRLTKDYQVYLPSYFNESHPETWFEIVSQNRVTMNNLPFDIEALSLAFYPLYRAYGTSHVPDFFTSNIEASYRKYLRFKNLVKLRGGY